MGDRGDKEEAAELVHRFKPPETKRLEARQNWRLQCSKFADDLLLVIFDSEEEVNIQDLDAVCVFSENGEVLSA